MEDFQIVDMLFHREEYGLQELSASYQSYCEAIAMRILRDHEDVKECVNDTWYQTWTLIPPNRPISLKAFVGKITRGLAIDKLRYKTAAKRPDYHLADIEQEAAELASAWNTVEEKLEELELIHLLNQFLEELSADDRDIFIRRYWFFDSLDAIADRHQKTKSSIRGRLYRSRSKLRDFLQKNEVDV